MLIISVFNRATWCWRTARWGIVFHVLSCLLSCLVLGGSCLAIQLIGEEGAGYSLFIGFHDVFSVWFDN